MSKNLFQILNGYDNSKGLNPIGYTINRSYDRVLESLDKFLNQQGDVFGIQSVDTMSFDKNGFSTNPDSAIWKMKLNFTGSMIVQYNDCYDIIKFGNQQSASFQNPFVHNDDMLPYQLSSDALGRTNVEKFVVGASLDFMQLGQQYFNTFFSNPAKDVKITQQQIQKLIDKRCLRAQIILPNRNNKSIIVGVIGQTPFTNNACCYISTMLLGSSQWSDSGIVLKVQEKGKQSYQILPDGSEIKFPYKGQRYDMSSNSIGGVNRKNYENLWLKSSVHKYGGDKIKPLQLIKPQLQTCYVRLFIPRDRAGELTDILSPEMNQNIFNTFEAKVNEVENDVSVFQGNFADNIQLLCEKLGNVVANSSNGFVYNRDLRPESFSRSNVVSYKTLDDRTEIVRFGPYREKDLSGGKQVCFDCSSLPLLFWYNSGIIRDQEQTAPVFGSGSYMSAAAKINEIIKPQYKVIRMDITSDTEILTGDIMWCLASERKERQDYGHVAMAYVVQQGSNKIIKTIELNSSSQTGNVIVQKARNDNKVSNFYRHLIRVVKVQNNEK